MNGVAGLRVRCLPRAQALRPYLGATSDRRGKGLLVRCKDVLDRETA